MMIAERLGIPETYLGPSAHPFGLSAVSHRQGEEKASKSGQAKVIVV